MSVDLGTAHGSITLDAAGVEQGINDAVAALTRLQASADAVGKSIGASATQVGKAGREIGQGLAKGAQDAAKGVGDVQKAAAQADGNVEKLAKSSNNAGAAFEKLANSAAVIGGALAAGLVAAVKSAADLETGVARISTIAPDIDVSQVTTSLRQMSTQVAQTSVQLAASLNNIFSSISVTQEQALKLTEEFGRGAVAAGTDAETFGTAILGVLNAYGLSVDQASHLSDVFFNTLKVGVINGNQLATGLGQVTQSAKLAGVNFDELGALIAGVTREGGEASTNVNNLANALNKITTEDAQKGLQELGITTKDANGNFRSFIDILADLKTRLDGLSAGDRAQVLQKLFPDAQARAGVATLISQLDTVRAALDENKTSAGAANAAYEKMGNTAAAQAQILRNTLVASLSEAGQLALPAFVGLAQRIKGVAEAFSELTPGQQSAILNTAAVTAAFLLASSAAIKVVTTVADIGSAVASATRGMIAGATAAYNFAAGLTALQVASVAGPLVIALGLAAVGTALTMDQLTDGVKKAAQAIGGDLGDAINKVQISKLDALKAFFTGIDVGADKAAAAARDWAQQIDTATLKAQHLASTQKEIDLIAKGGFGSSEQTKLRAINQALFDEIAVREELNRQEEIRNRLLTEEGEISAAFAAKQQAIVDSGLGMAASTGAFSAALASAAQAASDGTDAINNTSTATDQLIARFHSFAELQQVDLAQRFDDISAAMSKVQQVSGPLTAALDQINQKRAQGIPLTQREASLLQQIPGYLGEAQTAYNDLALAQAQTIIDRVNVAGGVNAIGQEFTGAIGPAAGLTGQVNALNGAILALQSSMSALGQENGRLAGQYNALQERIDALNQKVKDGGKLSGDEQSELAALLAAQKKIADQRGENAQKIRDEILAEQEATEARKAAIASIEAINAADLKVKSDPFIFREDHRGEAPVIPVPAAQQVTIEPVVDDASLAAVRAILQEPLQIPVSYEVAGDAASSIPGLTEFGPGDSPTGPGTIIQVTANTAPAETAIAAVQTALATLNSTTANPQLTATDNASTPIATVTNGINNIPPGHDTDIRATDNASQIIAGVRQAIDNLPTSFLITATVDTSGALSATADLRANMPSSPADEGPFRTLPDWSSVYASLAPAGTEALKDTRFVMAALSDTMTTGIEDVGQAATDEATNMAEQVGGAVEATVGALAAIGSVQGVTGQQLTLFAAGLAGIIAALVDVAGQFAEDGVAAAKALAESASGIVGIVVPAVEAFDALRRIVQPTADQIGVFAAGVTDLVRVIMAASADLESEALDGAKVFAETASQIVALVAPAVEAFDKLGSITQPTADQLGVFLSGIGNLVLVIVQASRLVAADAIPHASAFADLAAKSVGLIVPAVEGFAALRRVVQPTADQLGVFLSGITNLVLVITQAASAVSAEVLPHASEFADVVQKSIGLIIPAVEAFEKLKEITQPTADQLGVFLSGITNVALVVAQAAALFSTETLAHASNFADYSAKTLSLISQGVEGFAALARDDFRLPDESRINAFAATVGVLARAIADAAASMAEEAVAAAGVFSTEAGKTVALLGEGVEGFTKLLDFTPPTDAAIAAFVATVINVVRRVAEASKQIEAEAVKAAATFSEGAGKAVGLIGAAINDLNITESLDKEGKPKSTTRLVTTAEIDALVFLIGYVVGKLIELASRFDTGALARMSNLADAASKGLGALRGILDAINEAGQEKKPAEGDQSLTPAQAIDKLIGLFSEGLARLQVLATVAEQYKQVALGIRNTMYEAMQAISESIGQMPFGTGIGAAQLALATNNGQFLIRAEVIHRHDPVEFRMMGENGPWIVRSLEIDGKSREEVAGMVGEILMGDGTPDQQPQQ